MFVQIGRNPIHHTGCYGILQSMQENPDSAIEMLDFSVTYKSTNFTRLSANDLFSNILNLFPACIHFQDIAVSQDFEDLYTAVKAVFPVLTVNHGGKIGTFTSQKLEK